MKLLLPNKPPSPNDTSQRHKLTAIMNTITRKYYGFILVTCPDCGVINARHGDDFVECTNGDCALMFRASDAPDLFF